MKKIIVFYFPFLLLLTSSCQKDFLDKNPLDQISNETFWKDEKDAQTALIGVYSRLQATHYAQFRYVSDCLTDDCHNYQNEAQSLTISQGNLFSTTDGIVSSMYSQSYAGISACNIFLQNISKVEITQAVKERYIAEVKFLRAWFYFNLEQFYGDVVIYSAPPTIESSKIKQSSRREVLNFIHKDLDDAIANLPNNSYTGRIVKNSALALKAKVYLSDNKWNEAATTANLVILSGKTQLFNDYSKLFITSGQNSEPSEILFSSRFLNPDNFHSYQIFVAWYSGPNPRKELIRDYESKDGLPITQSPLYNPNNPYLNRDPRLLQSIQVKPWTINGNVIQQETTITGFRIQKGIDSTLGPIGYETRSDNDIIHLRYADVLLMYAEAKNEESGPNQSVYDAVNMVRARSGMPALVGGLTQNAMRDKIRHERRIELTFEGHRYFDLKRWKNIAQVLATVDEPGLGVGGLKFLPHHYSWPFPQTEIDVNPMLDQKAGY